MDKAYTEPSIDEYLRERLMPVEGSIPHIPGIEMYTLQGGEKLGAGASRRRSVKAVQDGGSP